MRGKRQDLDSIAECSRNIPAYAGKTHAENLTKQAREEHPRVCGENGIRVLYPQGGIGTSPRMRGKLRARCRRPEPPRNIPAYAGKTAVMHFAFDQQTEHPRVCGENLAARTAGYPVCGTSPRMRGKLRMAIEAVIPLRNPRVCGENRLGRVQRELGTGTSPRMRGKRGECLGNPRADGNIPAYAGKTALTRRDVVLHEEHPRVCGENG